MGKKSPYSQVEQHWIFWALIMVGGFFGVYTYSVRGGVFANAQTANITRFVMFLGQGNWSQALYLLLPISVYFFGAMLSEFLSRKLPNDRRFGWGVTLICVEIAVVIFLGLLPKEAPDQICQVALNFICSMQFTTFRKNQGTPMATTFVTNHIRETGAYLIKWACDKDRRALRLSRLHGSMIFMFMLGGLLSSVMCRFFDVRAIFGTIPILLYILIRLLITK